MRWLLLAVVAASCAGAVDATATVYQVSFGGGSTRAYSLPSGVGFTYGAPAGDTATVTGRYTFNTNDQSTAADGKGETFYAGSVGSVTISNLVNLPSATYTFGSPRVILDVKGMTVGSGIAVSLAPDVVGNTPDVVWVDGTPFEVKHPEPNGGHELNEFSTAITSIAAVAAVPEPASLLLLGLAAGAVRHRNPA